MPQRMITSISKTLTNIRVLNQFERHILILSCDGLVHAECT